VRAWSDRVVIPTYPAGSPERSPIFLERRVYQGSSGRAYPNPVTDRVSDEKVDRAYVAIHLENEYITLLILPEIGGRIHVGQDVTNGYDFFYRQRVIKPALVGLLGPWISGGVEFNWPQHHRPSTFMPVDWSIEEADDGSRTVWLSEHEPMGRMKGSVGITLHPGRSLVEVRARLYNRTPFVQTFLWWANVAVRVHDQYEVFFPPDVWHVADHAKRAMATFPIARLPYYGVDYGQGPGGGTDIRWYRNIPVPTSYMAMGSRHDFFGGYDHAAEAGLVHVADHRISPGKKLWTWGDHEFGHAWDRNLTDDDGPYVELMAGVYTDNQPDFSFLQPYETRTFVQSWYPIQRIGPPTLANEDVAVRLSAEAGRWRVGVAVTGAFPAATVRLERGSELLAERRADLAPDTPLVFEVSLPMRTVAAELRLRVFASDGRTLLDHVPETPDPGPLPAPASEPPAPTDVSTLEELYLTGLHLDQYRHATRSPEPYWREALRRDPDDARCNTALGAWRLRRGEPAIAERHMRVAIARLTRRNPNPRDGEPFYLLGVALRHLGRDDEAYDAFFKATWNQAWASPGYHAIAELDATRRDWTAVLEHAGSALRTNADDLKARDLRAAGLRYLGRFEEALQESEATLALDPLDLWAAFEHAWASRSLAVVVPDPGIGDLQTHLDVGLDLAAAGLWDDAIAAVEAAVGCDQHAPPWTRSRSTTWGGFMSGPATRTPRPNSGSRPGSYRPAPRSPGGSRRSRSCRARSWPIRQIREPRTTSGTCSTIAAATTRRSPAGSARPASIRSSRRPGETWASGTSMRAVVAALPSAHTGTRSRRTRPTGGCSTSGISSRSDGAGPPGDVLPAWRHIAISSPSATTWRWSWRRSTTISADTRPRSPSSRPDASTPGREARAWSRASTSAPTSASRRPRSADNGRPTRASTLPPRCGTRRTWARGSTS